MDYEINTSRKVTRIVRNPVFSALRNERIIAAELYYNLNGIYEYHRNALAMTSILFNAILLEPEAYRAIAENEKNVFGL